jgi:hypothetical protein
MRRLTASLVLLISLAPAAGLQAQEGAEVRLLADPGDVVWVGEKVDIHLELWTEALSFSGQAFTLPEALGGYLLRADSSTINVTERRGRVTWTGLRYTFNLYPQRPGKVVIPAFNVRFATSAGYGSEPRPYTFSTQPLAVTAQLPPGADTGSLLVTTTDFNVVASWQPELTGEGSIELKTGDALVLTVEREADEVPGMVFEPLPEFEIEGLGVYAAAPEVNDRVYRGELTGTRTDRITLVCALPGSYELPELTFQWWDQQREKLHQETIPALAIEVVQNPAWATPPPKEKANEGISFNRDYLWLVLAALLMWWPGWPLVRTFTAWLRSELRARRLAPLNPREPR